MFLPKAAEVGRKPCYLGLAHVPCAEGELMESQAKLGAYEALGTTEVFRMQLPALSYRAPSRGTVTRIQDIIT
eukprot:273634-Amphidinium_carterae.1